ncbi:MAG: PQQ-dependent sugar dehydrogenase [Idiomarina sp.]|nr:PQQ-dependent sugar dehydrogenase [Idiomarina sp.]
MTQSTPTRRYPKLVLATAIGFTLVGLSTAPALADTPQERVSVSESEVESSMRTEHSAIRVVQLVSDLEHPWAVAWLPDGRKLISERPGNLLLIDDDSVTALSGLPKIDAEEDQLTAPEGGNQGGLLDIALHPDYEDNGWIYFTYSSPGDNDGVAHEDYATGTALARARLNDDQDGLTDLETLYVENPRKEPGRHYGSRIVFPGDGTVIFSIGDRGIRRPSQDLTDPAGSMIRLHQDGGAYDDNPFVDMPPGNLRPEIFSFGHRNNQAIALHPDNGGIWTAEHGPYGGDLLHKVEKGKNYGWPMIAYGKEYDTEEKMGLIKSPPGVETPKYVWEDSMAPSGMAFYTGYHFSDWSNNLFVGSLYREQLHRLVLDGDEVSHTEVLLDGTVGRIRDVRQGPDGYLYVLTDESDGGLYRIEPAS